MFIVTGISGPWTLCWELNGSVQLEPAGPAGNCFDRTAVHDHVDMAPGGAQVVSHADCFEACGACDDIAIVQSFTTRSDRDFDLHSGHVSPAFEIAGIVADPCGSSIEPSQTSFSLPTSQQIHETIVLRI